MTHDLFKTVIETFGSPLDSVHLTEIREGVFYAALNFEGGVTISARPSDAIALALRMGTPVLATAELFAAVGIEIPDAADDEVEKFRDCAQYAKFSSATADKIIAQVRELDRLDDIRKLTALMANPA